uniref:Uncharacterized protein n=1 Tax=Trypanosoma vivax (strain Y486) TaxID=1055687 RepID=G0U612_TRYVY|nr:hypothetical protein, unlikely [Trypanosoma vivax Y486]
MHVFWVLRHSPLPYKCVRVYIPISFLTIILLPTKSRPINTCYLSSVKSKTTRDAVRLRRYGKKKTATKLHLHLQLAANALPKRGVDSGTCRTTFGAGKIRQGKGTWRQAVRHSDRRRTICIYLKGSHVPMSTLIPTCAQPPPKLCPFSGSFSSKSLRKE